MTRFCGTEGVGSSMSYRRGGAGGGYGQRRGRGGPNRGGGRGRGSWRDSDEGHGRREGGRKQGPPPGLSGKDIGMYYAHRSRAKKKAQERNSVMMVMFRDVVHVYLVYNNGYPVI